MSRKWTQTKEKCFFIYWRFNNYLISGFSILLALFGGEQAFDDVTTDIIFLGQIEQLADLGCTLGSKTTGNISVGKSGNFLSKFIDSFSILYSCHCGDMLISLQQKSLKSICTPITSELLPQIGYIFLCCVCYCQDKFYICKKIFRKSNCRLDFLKIHSGQKFSM